MSEIITIPTKEGWETEFIQDTVYTVYDFPWNIVDRDLEHVGILSKKHRGAYYYNTFFTFDIETTTINCEDPFAFMYHWQACVHGMVVFGRTWNEFLKFLGDMKKVYMTNESLRLVGYVHNLPFEFQFMKDFIEVSEMFAVDLHKPVKFLDNFGIEWRCSYKLSNKGLLSWLSDTPTCPFDKLDGQEYDYRIIRTPSTQLKPYEKAYCYIDVKGLYYALLERFKDDNIISIPLTSTGYVRRKARYMVGKNPKNREIFKKKALTVDTYTMCKEASRGGNTHANALYTGRIVDNVGSFDIQSSYPSVIKNGYFPSTNWTKVDIDSEDDFKYYIDNFCCLLRIAFENIRTKSFQPFPYIPVSKCRNMSVKETVRDNGRVIKSPYLETTMLEVDFNIIKNQYEWDSVYVGDFYVAKRGKLPQELILSMLDDYAAKTELKGIPDQYENYMKSKNRLNAYFGMMLTDIVRDIILYIDNEWDIEKQVDEDGEPIPRDKVIEYSLNKYYKSRNSFLSYQDGIYIAAHARKALQDALDECGLDALYCDTDSVYLKNMNKHASWFMERNRQIVDHDDSEEICGYAVDRKGNKQYLGVWEKDTHTYKGFITLGSKKYAYEKDDGSIVVTVAGLNKEQGGRYLKQKGGLSAFRSGLVFPAQAFDDEEDKMYDVSGRTTAYYNEKAVGNITVNGDTFLTASNIAIVDATYTLSTTEEYDEIVDSVQRAISLIG